MSETLYTGLPAGDYCNVIQGCPTNSGCTGDVITVGGDGKALIRITNSEEPFLAIHIGKPYSASLKCALDHIFQNKML